MKTTSWSFGGNALPQWRSGAIYLYDEPWWLAFCGWFIWSILGSGCNLLHWIAMPSFLKVTREGCEYTWRDYYGDVGQLWHIYVFDKAFQWHHAHPKHKEIVVELGYDRIKEIFGKHEPKYFKDCEDRHQLNG
jgi:hypothetical protein